MEFDRETLLDAFRDIGRKAWQEGLTIEIAVYGGSALMLIFDWRKTTKDVDAVFEGNRETVRRLAAGIADERGWPADWLNDAVKGFLSVFVSKNALDRPRRSPEAPELQEPALAYR